MGTIGASLYQSNNTVKAEKAVEHVTTSAVAAVAEAAASPPSDSDGRISLEHSLTMAVVQAAKENRLKDAGKVLALIAALEEKKNGSPSLTPALAPEEAA
jgi:hypothetical protein